MQGGALALGLGGQSRRRNHGLPQLNLARRGVGTGRRADSATCAGFGEKSGGTPSLPAPCSSSTELWHLRLRPRLASVSKIF